MDQLGSPYVDHLDPICVVDRAELEEKKENKNKYKMRVKISYILKDRNWQSLPELVINKCLLELKLIIKTAVHIAYFNMRLYTQPCVMVILLLDMG